MTDQTIKIIMPEQKQKSSPKKKKQVIYKEKPESSLKEEIKKEIQTLEEKKVNVPKGLRGILQKAAINKAIYERKKFLNVERKTQMTKAQVKAIKSNLELEQEKEKLKAIRNRNKVNFSDISESPKDEKRSVKFDDLF
ncbi:MAG: hypothetical protein ACFFHD_05615 [Promethearchaeota archaeon]